MTKLSKGPKKLFDLLQTKKSGDELTEAEILTTTQWKPKSFETEKKKNKISPFLTDLSNGRYRVVHDGNRLSEKHFHEVFTQVKPQTIVPRIGDSLQGKAEAYVVEEVLGAGAVGQVWKARGATTTNLVALKIMQPRADLLDSSMLGNVTERFRREANNGLKLNHSQVIRHLDIGEWQKELVRSSV